MKTYTFYSPKTAGSTVTCLNMALAYQMQNPGKKVALLQGALYPDLHLYIGLQKPRQTLHQLLAFQDTPEWNTNLIEQLKTSQIIDLIPSPAGAEWQDFDSENWQKIQDLLEAKYDVLFIDLGRDIPQWCKESIFDTSNKIITTCCLDPMSLASLEGFLSHHPQHKKKQYLLINQVPKEANALIKKHLAKHEKMILGLLPLETKTMWTQVYQQFPVVMQKRSKWKKALQIALKNLSDAK